MCRHSRPDGWQGGGAQGGTSHRLAEEAWPVVADVADLYACSSTDVLLAAVGYPYMAMRGEVHSFLPDGGLFLTTLPPVLTPDSKGY